MNKRILFLKKPDNGCTYYRTTIPYVALKNTYPSLVEICEESKFHLFPNSHQYDTYIFLRNRDKYLHSQFIPWAKRNKKKVIMDIDDLFWDLPDYNPVKRFWKQEHFYNITENIKNVDLVTCSTVPLANYVSNHFNSNVAVIPNFLEQTLPYKQLYNKTPHVAWAGSNTHTGDFPEYLIHLIKELVNSNKIRFTIIGEVPSFFEGIAGNIPWCSMYEYHTKLYDANIDIGLIVCKDNQFNQCKTPIKFLEYSACSIASIADSIYPYERVVQNGVNGFLVKTENDWATYLQYLIQNKPEREKIARTAHSDVNVNHTLRFNSEGYLKLLECITE